MAHGTVKSTIKTCRQWFPLFKKRKSKNRHGTQVCIDKDCAPVVQAYQSIPINRLSRINQESGSDHAAASLLFEEFIGMQSNA